MTDHFYTNLPRVTFNYLRQLRIPITKKNLEKILKENPYYPSLYSLSSVFNRFNISNEALYFEEENLSELKPPFITYLKNQPTGKDFVLITKMSSNKVSYISNTNREKIINKEKFLKDWEKVIFIAEKNEKSGEKNYVENLKKEKKEKIKSFMVIINSVIISALVIALAFLNLAFAEIAAAGSLLFIKSLGVAATVLLLLFEFNKNNSFVKGFCSADKQINCDAVLNSKGAKFFGFGWSEIGFFYFIGTTIFLLFPGIIFSEKTSWLSLTNLVCAPYILFSIYYQWRIVKQWCFFCLTVQCILILQLAWSLNYFPKNFEWPTIDISVASGLLISILLPLTVWIIIKPILKDARSESIYHTAYKRLLYDPERFNGFLMKQPVTPEHKNVGIILGNQEAGNTIIVVCNPYCEPCAKAHLALNGLIESNNEINLKIIFTASNDESDKRKKPVAHLLAVHSKGNASMALQALNDWYSGKKNYNDFAANYPLNGELDNQKEKIDAMHIWCKEAGIMHTPTIFVNENKLPENYSVEELKEIL